MGRKPILLSRRQAEWLSVICPTSSREGAQAKMFTGTFERTLDAKGRLSLPAALRSEIEEQVYVLPAPDVDALYVFSKDAFKDWALSLFEKRGGFDARKRADQALMRKITSKATPQAIDKASRISLSDALRKKIGSEREVTVVGNWDHIEIWNRDAWAQVEAEEDDEDLFFID